MSIREDIVERKGDLTVLYQLLTLAKGARASLYGGITLVVTSSLLAMVSARLLGTLVEQIYRKGDLSTVMARALSVVGLELLVILVAFCGRSIIARGAITAIYQIRMTLFAHLQKLPSSYFDTTPQGRTVTRLTHDIEALEEFFSGTLGRVIGSSVMALSAMAAMLVTDLQLGILVVVSTLPALAVTYFSRGVSRVNNREISKRHSAINARLAEFINGISVIRSLGLEGWSKAKFDALTSAYYQSNMKLLRIFSILRPVIGSLSTIPLVLFLYFAGHKVALGLVSLGTLVSFIRYFERFGRPLMEISYELHVIQTAFASAERVSVLLNESVEEKALGANGAHAPSEIRGGVEFKEVSMRYSGERAALEAVSFQVLPGEKVGVTGATGSGKTTTMSLLARLYEFQSGEILIDGISIRNYEREALRKLLGFVTQEVMIVRGSVRENLTLGRGYSDSAILEVCKETGLMKIFSRNNLSLDSELLEHGANLSVGERQLLSFTRVLILNPKILVLDEATANVDPYFEGILHDAMDKAMKGRTVFLIAHRLSTLATCSKILVFAGGKIAEQGTPEALIRQGGIYARLTALQKRSPERDILE